MSSHSVSEYRLKNSLRAAGVLAVIQLDKIRDNSVTAVQDNPIFGNLTSQLVCTYLSLFLLPSNLLGPLFSYTKLNYL
jgi:hypothetical protein